MVDKGRKYDADSIILLLYYFKLLKIDLVVPAMINSVTIDSTSSGLHSKTCSLCGDFWLLI